MHIIKLALGTVAACGSLAAANAAIVPASKVPVADVIALVSNGKTRKPIQCGEFMYFDKNAKECTDARTAER